jgi:FkbM family methyltransferase
VTSYYDIENCYKFILGRSLNEIEREAIARNLLQLTDLPLEEHRRRFLSSAEFHHRHGELIFNNYVPKPIIVLFETTHNFKLYIDLRQYHISFGIMRGEYEKFDVSLMKAIVPDDGHFIDVGGNVGYYSLCVAARPSFTGKVLAFEPLPKFWSLFDRSIRENDLGNRVSVRQLALAETPGEMHLSDAEETTNAGATRLVAHAAGQSAGRLTEVEALDRVADGLRPDALKVDIQGAEGLFLKGAARTIAAHKPTLLMEINRDMLAILSRTSPAAIHQQLSELGYSVWSSSGGSLARVATASELDVNFPAGRVGNILAVHGGRLDQVRERVQPLGVKLEGPKARRSRQKENTL